MYEFLELGMSHANIAQLPSKCQEILSFIYVEPVKILMKVILFTASQFVVTVRQKLDLVLVLPSSLNVPAVLQ